MKRWPNFSSIFHLCRQNSSPEFPCARFFTCSSAFSDVRCLFWGVLFCPPARTKIGSRNRSNFHSHCQGGETARKFRRKSAISLGTRRIKSQPLALEFQTSKLQRLFALECVGNRSDFQPAVEACNRNCRDRAISAHSSYPLLSLSFWEKCCEREMNLPFAKNILNSTFEIFKLLRENVSLA